MNKDRRKRICFITVRHPSFGVGGSEVQSFLYAKEFASQGWDVYFLSKIHKEKIEGFDDPNITELFYEGSRIGFFNHIKVLKLLVANKIEIIFFRNNTFQLGLLVLSGRLYKWRTIWSVKSDLTCGKDAATIRARNNESSNGGFSIRNLQYAIEDKIFGYGVKNSYTILVQNNYQYDVIKRDFNLDSTVLYSSAKIPIKPTKAENMVVFIATIKYMKQPELFCEIAQRLSNRGYRFLLIGSNYKDKEKADNLLELVAKSNVQYLGYQSLDSIREILRSTRLLINTSQFEGFPNSFVQAFTYGIPVASLNVDPDGIIEKYSLGIVANGDVDRLTIEVGKLLENNDRWQQLSDNCYNFAKEKLNIKRSVSSLIENFGNEAKEISNRIRC